VPTITLEGQSNAQKLQIFAWFISKQATKNCSLNFFSGPDNIIQKSLDPTNSRHHPKKLTTKVPGFFNRS